MNDSNALGRYFLIRALCAITVLGISANAAQAEIISYYFRSQTPRIGSIDAVGFFSYELPPPGSMVFRDDDNITTIAYPLRNFSYYWNGDRYLSANTVGSPPFISVVDAHRSDEFSAAGDRMTLFTDVPSSGGTINTSMNFQSVFVGNASLPLDSILTSANLLANINIWPLERVRFLGQSNGIVFDGFIDELGFLSSLIPEPSSTDTVWLGGSNNFSTPAMWSHGEVPNSNSTVYFSLVPTQGAMTDVIPFDADVSVDGIGFLGSNRAEFQLFGNSVFSSGPLELRDSVELTVKTGYIETIGLVVGEAGSGDLQLKQQARLATFENGRVGSGSASTGTVEVDDSSWAHTGHLDIGLRGTGSVLLSNAGTVGVNGSLGIGVEAGSKGTVTIDGSQSAFEASGELSVGNGGYGEIKIENEGSLSSGNASVGTSGNGEGFVTVDGVNSKWENNGTLTLGSASGLNNDIHGSLIVRNKGLVKALDSVEARAGGMIAVESKETAKISVIQTPELKLVGGSASGGLLMGDGRLEGVSGGDTKLVNSGLIVLGSETSAPRINQGDGIEAHFNIVGGYEQTSAGQLNISLKDDNYLHDVRHYVNSPPQIISTEVFVNEHALLDGKLKVDIEKRFPHHGESIHVVDYKSHMGEFSEIESPKLDANGLKLVPVYSKSGMSLVVPQKVVLLFGEPASFEMTVKEHKLVNESEYLITNEGSMPAADLSAIGAEITSRVQKAFTDSGIQGVVVVDGNAPDARTGDYVQIFFTEPIDENLLGYMVSPWDYLNANANERAAVFVSGSESPSPSTIESLVKTTIHEIGHALGMRHVAEDPILSSGSTTEDMLTFANGPFDIVDPNSSGNHNPMFYLKRYIDGISVADLLTENIKSGEWDLNDGSSLVDAVLSFEAAQLTMYDVRISMGLPAGDGVETALLPNLYFDEITIEELEGLKLSGIEGELFRIVAASQLGGPLDILLTTGDPFVENAGLISVSPGSSSVFLQRHSLNSLGYETIASGSFVVSITAIPEPSSLLLGALTAVGLLAWTRSKTKRPIESAK